MIFVFNALFYARKVKTKEDKNFKLMHVFDIEDIFWDYRESFKVR